MKIIISNQSELPIYAQIKEQIKEQILNGQLADGTVLPSIRGLAKELSVSVITTSRAYSDLEAEGFIATAQGRGSIVLSRNNDILREQYLKRIEEGLNTAIRTAGLIDLPREELHTMVDMLWKTQ
ncbi:MAG: GntR family transcriptional regulator [Lachnospiraceae bacterium]|nr:GntR family transcriptional regulator [Lachnospiraceae bacterium]